MSKPVTEQLKDRWRTLRDEERGALAEVLCSAYKDATGAYPNDRLREALYDAVIQNV